MRIFYQDPFVTLYHGESLHVLLTLDSDTIDALITDPPYSSGGFTRGDKMQTVEDKYISTGVELVRQTFSGDNRDARSWCYWSALWLAECHRIVKPSGYAMTFSDWRQLPLAADAFQAGGFIWRGIINWDKGEGARAPHRGYWRHQCEYVVWGSKGPTRQLTHAGPFAGCIRHTIKKTDKHHITGKPTALMVDLLRCLEPGETILDPFAGSGTTLVAAKAAGIKSIGIECDAVNCEKAARRLRQHRLATV